MERKDNSLKTLASRKTEKFQAIRTLFSSGKLLSPLLTTDAGSFDIFVLERLAVLGHDLCTYLLSKFCFENPLSL